VLPQVCFVLFFFKYWISSTVTFYPINYYFLQSLLTCIVNSLGSISFHQNAAILLESTAMYTSSFITHPAAQKIVWSILVAPEISILHQIGFFPSCTVPSVFLVNYCCLKKYFSLKWYILSRTLLSNLEFLSFLQSDPCLSF
jgi:hypothetical protein